MLRRKLLIILAGVTALLLVLATAALWSMQSILAQLDGISGQDSRLAEDAQQLASAVSAVELELYAIHAGRERHLDNLLDHMQVMRAVSHRLREDARGLDVQASYAELSSRVEAFEKHVVSMVSTTDTRIAGEHNARSRELAAGLRGQITDISNHLHRHLHEAQLSLSARFRWTVIGLALGFLLVINASILLMLRLSEMILRPVDQLVEASRQLAAERFEHRVPLGRHDEFDELAKAFNGLAQQLQQNEQRRIEVLGQLALALNHELNNAIGIIELQLPLLRRQSGGSERHEKYLQQIHQTLQRMSKVVESLKHVRRIVLTDYLAGVKMLDLARSVEPEGSAQPEGAPASEQPSQGPSPRASPTEPGPISV